MMAQKVMQMWMAFGMQPSGSMDQVQRPGGTCRMMA